MALARSPSLVALLVILVILLLAPLQDVKAAGRTDANLAPATSGKAPPPLPKILPPPVVKPAPDSNGRTDLPNDYERGAIKLKLRAGLKIADVLARHGLTGGYRYLSPPPFSQWDVAVGIDRNFRVEVPIGTEKAYVAALSKSTAAFEWVHMVWLPNGSGALLAPNDPKYTQGTSPTWAGSTWSEPGIEQ